MEDKCTKFISLSVSRSGQISGPGVPLSVATRRYSSLPGSERTRNGRNGISGMADLSSGLSEKRWFYKMRLGLARPTDDRSGYRRLSWISPRKEEKC